MKAKRRLFVSNRRAAFSLICIEYQEYRRAFLCPINPRRTRKNDLYEMKDSPCCYRDGVRRQLFASHLPSDSTSSFLLRSYTALRRSVQEVSIFDMLLDNSPNEIAGRRLFLFFIVLGRPVCMKVELRPALSFLRDMVRGSSQTICNFKRKPVASRRRNCLYVWTIAVTFADG